MKLWITADKRARKALTFLVLTVGLTVGSLATSIPTAEARWVRRCHRVRVHHHWVTRCHRVRRYH